MNILWFIFYSSLSFSPSFVVCVQGCPTKQKWWKRFLACASVYVYVRSSQVQNAKILGQIFMEKMGWWYINKFILCVHTHVYIEKPSHRLTLSQTDRQADRQWEDKSGKVKPMRQRQAVSVLADAYVHRSFSPWRADACVRYMSFILENENHGVSSVLKILKATHTHAHTYSNPNGATR